MLKNNIKIVVFFLVLIANPLNGLAHVISIHHIQYSGLTYLAVQSFNYANPSQPFWTIYDFCTSIQQALQLPIFFLLKCRFCSDGCCSFAITGCSYYCRGTDRNAHIPTRLSGDIRISSSAALFRGSEQLLFRW